jgi:Spx/MgsR family transcriptional regulator
MEKPARIIVYGIANCQSVKKARDWLQEHALAYAFHDFKKAGVPLPRLKAWVKHFGWESVLNRKGTTWRLLREEEKTLILNASSAINAMAQHPSLIKRPVIEFPHGQLTLGVNPEAWSNVIE